MQFANERDFATFLKEHSGSLGAILLCGTEEYLIGNWRREILELFGGEESFNLQKLDGKALDLDALYDATQMLPLFAEAKCVYLANVDPAGFLAADVKKLEEILRELPPECALLLTVDVPAYNPKNVASKKLVALLNQYGSVLELNGRDRASMVRYLQTGVKSAGAKLSPELARYILDICETDMQSLANEIAKIAGFASGNEITKEHIDAIACPRTEVKIFDLSKEILAGHAGRAIEILRDLFYQRESPVGITATLIMSYTDVYRAKVAQASGKTVQDVTALFNYRGREFRVRNGFSTKISLGGVRRGLGHLYTCERELKGSALAGEFVLEKTVLALLATREG